MRSIWFRERGQDLWTISKRSREELQLKQTGECAQLRIYIRCTMKVQHCKSHGVFIKCRLREWRLHQCEVMSFRSCGCFPRMRSIWLRERGQDLWTMCNIKSPGLDGPSGACGGRDVPSSRRPASRCRGTWRPPAGAQRHWDPALVPLSVNQSWQQVETAADWIKLQLAWPEAALPRCAGKTKSSPRAPSALRGACSP